MPGPGYRWTCPRCEAVNEAQADTCAGCGCPSRISPAALQPPRDPHEIPDHFLKDPGIGWLMLPEMPAASLLVLAAPFWAVSLLSQGYPIAALCLLIGAGGFGYAAYRAIRANRKWATYFSILGLLIVGLAVASGT